MSLAVAKAVPAALVDIAVRLLSRGTQPRLALEVLRNGLQHKREARAAFASLSTKRSARIQCLRKKRKRGSQPHSRPLAALLSRNLRIHICSMNLAKRHGEERHRRICKPASVGCRRYTEVFSVRRQGQALGKTPEHHRVIMLAHRRPVKKI